MSFKNIDVQALPEGWHARFFADLTDFRMGKTPPRNRDEYWDNGVYPWVSIADMEPFGTVTDTKEKVSEHAHQQVFRRALVPSGSLLMSFKLTIGRLAKLGIPAYHNEAIISFRPTVEEVDTDFLFYYLAQINYRDYQDTAVKGKTLNKSKMEKLEIALPPLLEQRKIAAVLGMVQQAIEQQERLLALTTELKKALLHKLFTEGLRGEPQKQTEIGLVPESWEVLELQDLCQLIVDCPHTTPKFQTEGIRVARNFNIREGQFVAEPVSFTSEEEYRLRIKRAEPLPGDILFSREAPVGEACVIPDGMQVSLGQRTMLLRPHAAKLDAQFMVYSFYSLNARSRMRATASGLTVPHLNVADVRSLLVPIPSLESQQRIASAILTVDTKGGCHRRKRAAFADLFRTLLHQLMTAQIRVHDLELPGLN